MRGRVWTPRAQAVFTQWAGKKPDADVAMLTGGHSVRTIRARREAAGIPAFVHRRKAWTRRDWLLSAAAGLIGDDCPAPDRLEYGRPVGAG
jgi:hypothetical protein